jgi:hypothetical protein
MEIPVAASVGRRDPKVVFQRPVAFMPTTIGVLITAQ